MKVSTIMLKPSRPVVYMNVTDVSAEELKKRIQRVLTAYNKKIERQEESDDE